MRLQFAYACLPVENKPTAAPRNYLAEIKKAGIALLKGVTKDYGDVFRLFPVLDGQTDKPNSSSTTTTAAASPVLDVDNTGTSGAKAGSANNGAMANYISSTSTIDPTATGTTGANSSTSALKKYLGS